MCKDKKKEQFFAKVVTTTFIKLSICSCGEMSNVDPPQVNKNSWTTTWNDVVCFCFTSYIS